MARPEKIFKWCVLDTDVDGNPLKSYPPYEIYQTGLLPGEPVARLWYNQQVSDTSQWITFLSGNDSTDGGIEPLGTIKVITTAAVTGGFDPSTVWAGTWVNRGTDTLAGVNVTIFEKTSLTPVLALP